MFQVSSQLAIPPTIHPAPRGGVSFDLVAPEIRARRTFTTGDALSDFSTAILASVGLLMLSIPLMNKRAGRLAPFLAKTSERFLRLRLTEKQQETFLKTFTDRQLLEKRVKQIFMGAIFLLGITNYQTSYNSKQPSLFYSTLIRDVGSLIGTFFPNPVTFLVYLTGGLFYDAGKQNDIANNNTPLLRREWDLKRLLKHPQSTFLQELSSSLHFVRDDFARIYQIQHWKSLLKDFQNQDAWKTPKPYHTSIGAQFLTASLTMAIIGLLSKKSRIKQFAGLMIIPAEFFLAFPLMNRARRQKKELDGAMVLAGFPMVMLGSCFSPIYSSSLFFMEGFEIFGGALGLKGLNLNSKRFKSLREEIEWLALQSKRNPELTSADILKQLDRPTEATSKLTQRLGKSRILELKQLLRQAEVAHKQGVTLQTFLSPALHADGDVHHRHGNSVRFIG